MKTSGSDFIDALHELGHMDEFKKPILNDLTVILHSTELANPFESLRSIVSGSAWPEGIILVGEKIDPSSNVLIEKITNVGLRVEPVYMKDLNRGASLNQGIYRVRTRFVAIIEAGWIISNSWLNSLTRHLRKSAGAIITGVPGLSRSGNLATRPITPHIPRVYQGPELDEQPLVYGNMGMALESLANIGLFDEDIKMNSIEDLDWGYRALRSGVPIIYFPGVTSQHEGEEKNRDRIYLQSDYFQKVGYFYGINLRKGDWFIAKQAGFDLSRGFSSWMRAKLAGELEEEKRSRSIVTGTLSGIGSGFSRKYKKKKSITNFSMQV
jgi:hypothetical protein